MAKILKNVDTITHTYNGQDILTNESYTIQPEDERALINDSQLMIDIANSLIIVNDGANDITDVNEAINWLKDKVFNPLSDDLGRPYVIAKSQKCGYTTIFTGNGDNTTIGDGLQMCWDASITDTGYWKTHDDDISIPVGFKRHQVEIQFIDTIAIKEGTVYYMNCLKNSYLDMYLLCSPTGVFLYKGNLYVNNTQTYLKVDHWVVKHPIQGDVPMGDELNTECCSQDIPNYFKYLFEVFVPTSDSISYGYLELELYRERTVDLDQSIANNDISLYQG